MKFILKHPWLVIVLVAAVTLFFALQLPRAILDNDIAGFIPRNNPDRIAYAKMEEEFGAQTIMLIGLRNTYGTVFERDFIDLVASLTAKLKGLDYVQSVSSLTSTEYIRGEGDRIIVSPLVDEEFAGSADEIVELKKKILSWELYHRSLVSDDFKSTQILVSLRAAAAGPADAKPIDPKKVVYDETQVLLAGMDLKGIEVYQAGVPTIGVLLSKNMQKDLVILIPVVIVVIVFSLFISFKRLGGILLPLGTVMICVIWAMGLMCLLGFTLSMIATVIPVILMAVGSASFPTTTTTCSITGESSTTRATRR
jgi:predicted RND superfamily exporter protein